MPSNLKLNNHQKRVTKLFARIRIALGASMPLLLVGLPIFSTLEHMPQSTNALDSHIGLIMQPPLLLSPMSSAKNSKSNLSTVHAIFSAIFNVISALKSRIQLLFAVKKSPILKSTVVSRTRTSHCLNTVKT